MGTEKPNGNHPSCRPSRGHERQRVHRPRGDDVDHRRIEAQRCPQIAVQKVDEPVGVALPQRRVHTPVFGQLRPLRLAHVDIGRLPHVRLHRIDRRNADQHKRNQTHRKHEQQKFQDIPNNKSRHAPTIPSLVKKPHNNPPQQAQTAPSPPTRKSTAVSARGGRHPQSEFRTSRNAQWAFRASRTAERLDVARPSRVEHNRLTPRTTGRRYSPATSRVRADEASASRS